MVLCVVVRLFLCGFSILVGCGDDLLSLVV